MQTGTELIAAHFIRQKNQTNTTLNIRATDTKLFTMKQPLQYMQHDVNYVVFQYLCFTPAALQQKIT